MKAETRVIGLSSPWLDEREEELVLEVLRSGRLSLGPTIDREGDGASAMGEFQRIREEVPQDHHYRVAVRLDLVGP